jgi:predicted nucleotidyltransferase component of viral defense system
VKRFTTQALIEAEAVRTRLGTDQVLLLVARSILVRHLARTYGDQFILKGGALLYHVHKSPRASFVDTDLATTTDEFLSTPKLAQLMTIDLGGFTLDARQDYWDPGGEVLKGDELPFSIHGFNSSLRNDTMNISVSVRKAEVLGPTGPYGYDATSLLSEEGYFYVHGLCLEELAAEKVLGWCTKPVLSKHLVDLALLARDHAQELKMEDMQSYLRQKFRSEAKSAETAGRYRHIGLTKASDLYRLFTEEKKLSQLRDNWNDELDRRVWLVKAEKDREASLADVDTVLHLVAETWNPVIAGL